MTAAHLLPDNSTALEQELARLSGRMDAIDPSAIATIWNAWSCPSPALTALAWALSVDQWSDDWDEMRKRQAIADSPAWHRVKGTRGAVEDAVARGTDAELTIREWWELHPPGRRGTSTLHLAIDDFEEAAATVRRVIPLVMSAKPKSRPIILVAGPVETGPVLLGGCVHTTTRISIDPQSYDGDDASGVVAFGGITSIRHEITVGPQ